MEKQFSLFKPSFPALALAKARGKTQKNKKKTT